ncbi:hypothetical protein [Paraliobacillus zengyii]|nr:hypothetical protein [Paraliobacillus zengyii]
MTVHSSILDYRKQKTIDEIIARNKKSRDFNEKKKNLKKQQ